MTCIQDGKPFSEQFALLQKALANDQCLPGSLRAADCSCINATATRRKPNRSRPALLKAVASDQPSAMAHFALSNLYWVEGELDKAQWHVKQAYGIGPEFRVRDQQSGLDDGTSKRDPDLERALTLAETALQTAPTDPRFLDTYGSILVLQKKYDEAITSLQKALPKRRSSEQ